MSAIAARPLGETDQAICDRLQLTALQITFSDAVYSPAQTHAEIGKLALELVMNHRRSGINLPALRRAVRSKDEADFVDTLLRESMAIATNRQAENPA